MALTDIEKGLLLRLFNRGGYVLDFVTADFDTFTMGSIGVALCQRYGLSKGKSLTAYVNDADGDDAAKLLSDLFEYYEQMPAYDRERSGESDEWHSDEYRRLYLKCKPIIERERGGVVANYQRADVKAHFNSDYMEQQIDLLFTARSENPTEAIGKAKELVENCCKTILEENGEVYDKSWGVSDLVKNTMSCLSITADEINEDQPAGKTVKRILGSLSGIAGGLSELRNHYGSGHGKSDSYRGLSVRHAKLAVGASVTLVEYLWDAHLWRKHQTDSGDGVSSQA